MVDVVDLKGINECRQKLVSDYVKYYRRLGYTEAKPLPVTSHQDASVIFIGSAISGLKKDYLSDFNIPEGGIVVAQNAIRTRNIQRMLDDNFDPKWGSFFTNIDTVVPYYRKKEAFDEVLSFFYDIAKIPENDLVLRVNSNDKELFDLVQSRYVGGLEIDANSEQYYRHKVGMENVYGENFNFAIKHKYTREYSDVGNFIIFRDKRTKQPLFIEVGFGDTVIMQAREGLNHVMDCYPFPHHDALDRNYKFKDCIITATAMMREGLEPSSHDQQSKILYKYLRGIYYFADQGNMQVQDLSRVLYHSEAMIFGDVKVQPRIVEIFNQRQNRIKELNQMTLLRITKKGNEL